MTKDLQDMLEAAKKVVLTPEEKEQQRRSFTYGPAAPPFAGFKGWEPRSRNDKSVFGLKRHGPKPR